jgi:hypothetical protein
MVGTNYWLEKQIMRDNSILGRRLEGNTFLDGTNVGGYVVQKGTKYKEYHDTIMQSK